MSLYFHPPLKKETRIFPITIENKTMLIVDDFEITNLGAVRTAWKILFRAAREDAER